MVKAKALALLSGGLDSTLAIRIILGQGIEVEALNFTSPFCLCNRGGRCNAAEAAKRFQIRLRVMDKGEEYLRVIRYPKYGYGKNMNPCIDCRIFMLKKAKAVARQIGARFIFTGEVLDQRPMSQHRKALELIDREAGLEGKVLRPLSAKLMPETEAEKKGWVDRNRLLDLRGRSRKRQIKLADEFGIKDYPCPAGGCLLTCKEFAAKLKDLFQHRKRITMKDINLLRIGRHFRFSENKVIVGRNETENRQLTYLKNKNDYLFEVPNCGSPIAVLQGRKTREAIERTASLTARYSDAKEKEVLVKYGRKTLDEHTIIVPKI